jgi:hypothetical protein
MLRQTDRQTDTTDHNQRTLNNVTNLVQVIVINLEFKVKKEDSYNYRATKGVVVSAALNLIRTKLAKALALSQFLL